jgi:hypothetical protein
LQILQRESGISLQSFGKPLSEQREDDAASPRRTVQKRPGPTWHLCVIIYGSPDLFEAIGKFADTCGYIFRILNTVIVTWNIEILTAFQEEGKRLSIRNLCPKFRPSSTCKEAL